MYPDAGLVKDRFEGFLFNGIGFYRSRQNHHPAQ
jgi:hypothetical protein